MSCHRITALLLTTAAVVFLGWGTSTVPAQEKKPDESKTKRATYAAKYRTVGDLAAGLDKQFKDVGSFRVVPDSSSNTLLLSGSAAVLDEVTQTLSKLDRRPQEVVVEILILHLVSRQGSENKPEKSEVEAKEFSGPIESVLKTVNALEKQGAIASVRRLRLPGLENQLAQLKEVASKPYTTGSVTTIGIGGGFGGFGGGGEPGLPGKGEGVPQVGGKGGAKTGKGGGVPRVSRTVAYKNVGTTVSLTPRVGTDGVVSLHLKINDDRSLQPEGGIPLGSDEKGLPIIATEFVLLEVEADLQVPSGQAVLARDVEMKSRQADERTLIVVTAQTVTP